MATYVQPMPSSGSELISVSQPSLSSNSTYLAENIGKDHNFTLTSNPSLSNADGYHKVIHQVKQVGDPAAIAGVNQVYAKDFTPAYVGAPTDTQLYNITGAGGVNQLTGNNSIANGGWSYSGSGLIYMWGRVTLPGTSNPTGTVTFASVSGTSIPFPTSIFSVQLTLRANSSTSQANTIAVLGSPSNTGFSWVFTGSTSYSHFYWFAIGV